jgi:hypothetical protein
MLGNDMLGPLSNPGSQSVAVIEARRFAKHFQFAVRGYGRARVAHDRQQLVSTPQHQIEVEPFVRRRPQIFFSGMGYAF